MGFASLYPSYSLQIRLRSGAATARPRVDAEASIVDQKAPHGRFFEVPVDFPASQGIAGGSADTAAADRVI
jgi:hypothetical protein